MIYGAVIDSTCRVLQQSCTRKGACLLYDLDRFRFRFHLLALGFQLGAVAFNALAWYLSRRRERSAAGNANIPSDDGKTAAAVTGPDDEDRGLDTEKEPLRRVLL